MARDLISSVSEWSSEEFGQLEQTDWHQRGSKRGQAGIRTLSY